MLAYWQSNWQFGIITICAAGLLWAVGRWFLLLVTMSARYPSRATRHERFWGGGRLPVAPPALGPEHRELSARHEPDRFLSHRALNRVRIPALLAAVAAALAGLAQLAITIVAVPDSSGAHWILAAAGAFFVSAIPLVLEINHGRERWELRAPREWRFLERLERPGPLRTPPEQSIPMPVALRSLRAAERALLALDDDRPSRDPLPSETAAEARYLARVRPLSARIAARQDSGEVEISGAVMREWVDAACAVLLGHHVAQPDTGAEADSPAERDTVVRPAHAESRRLSRVVALICVVLGLVFLGASWFVGAVDPAEVEFRLGRLFDGVVVIVSLAAAVATLMPALQAWARSLRRGRS